MTTGSDHIDEPESRPPVATVAEIRDRLVAAGLPCKTEQHDNEMRIIFEDRKCYLAFTVNASGRPLTASMPDTADYDVEFAQIIFQVFDGIGWKFQA